MMTSMFSSTLEFRGGHRGKETASYDGEKKQQQGFEQIEAEINKVQAGTRKAKRSRVGEGRQSLQSIESAQESTSKSDGGNGMTETPSNLPKTGGQVAKVLGSLTNDPRITNLLMLVIIAVGMGVHESLQTQVCSL